MLGSGDLGGGGKLPGHHLDIVELTKHRLQSFELNHRSVRRGDPVCHQLEEVPKSLATDPRRVHFSLITRRPDGGQSALERRCVVTDQLRKRTGKRRLRPCHVPRPGSGA